MTSLLPDSGLPPELDFEKDRDASPARMNRASNYIVSVMRSALALKPGYDEVVDRLNGISLQRIDLILEPIYIRATFIRDQLEAAIAAIGSAFTQVVTAPGFRTVPNVETGGGGVEILYSAVAGQSGIVQFYDAANVRVSYIGFVGHDGVMMYGSDTGAGHKFAGGPVFAPLVVVGSATDQKLALKGSDAPFVDGYDAAGAQLGYLRWYSGGAVRLTANSELFLRAGALDVLHATAAYVSIGAGPGTPVLINGAQASTEDDRWFLNQG